MNRIVPIVCAILVFASGCRSDDRQKLVIYSPHGKEMLSKYEEIFERQNPEVDVQWLDMGGQVAYDRIRTERENPQASLWWGGVSTAFSSAAGEGLLRSYTPSWATHVPDEAHDGQDLWYGTYFTPEVIAYNSDKISEEEAPRDWDELLDPAWADRVLIRYPMESHTMRTIYGAMIMTQATEQDGYDWLAALDKNVKTYTADPTQLYIRLARGEGDVTLWNLPDIFLQRNENGYNFGYKIPESGTPVITDAIAVVNNAPQPLLAEKFYELVTSDTALVTQAHSFYRIPVRNDVDQSLLPEWMRTEEIRQLPLDWQELEAKIPGWMQYWDENIKGRGADYLDR